MNIKKVLTASVTGLALLASYSAVAAVVQSGSCGGECTWTLDDKGVFSTQKGSTATGEFSIPEGTKTIGYPAFGGASGLTKITIPDSVTSISVYTFNDTGITGDLIIPDKVTSIGGWAFINVTGLTSVTIPASVVSIGRSAFASISLSEVFLSADSPLTEFTLRDGAIDLNKIVRFTADGKYIKGDKTYLGKEDYLAGIEFVYNQEKGKYQRIGKDGKCLKGFYNEDGTRDIKRIYSVSEAEEALGKNNKNTFSIKYR